MGALTDLWKSERGLLAVAIIIAATVLTAMGTMSITTWQETVVGVFGLYAVSKGATGVATVIRDGRIRTAAISAIGTNSGLSQETKSAAVTDVVATEVKS